MVLTAAAGRKRIVLGVRQDFPEYIRHRPPRRGRCAAIVSAHVLEQGFRLLAKRFAVVAVGPQLASSYRSTGADVLELIVSLIPKSVLASAPPPPRDLDASQPIRLLYVGRIDPEKRPDLLVDMLDLLNKSSSPRRWHLTVVGSGSLEAELAKEFERFEGIVEMRGYVKHGPDLYDLYRRSDIFVHTALTEGMPQALIEAQAFGLPIVATAVGGVPFTVADGSHALLVPPGSAEALAEKILSLANDSGLRRHLSENGIRHARELSLERQSERVASFIAAACP